MKKTNKVTLTDVYAKALTNKAFLKALRARPTKTKDVLKARGFSLSASDLKALTALALPKPKPIPPPPPPWEPDFTMANAILTVLTARIEKLEKTMKPTRGRGVSAKK